jgi:para-nitrobenzyl esterase
MFYLHGGGGTIGRGDDDGAALAATGKVVVVTINYRLGVLGWLAHPALTAESAHHSSGNYGVLDQIAALRWVKRNIAHFGGDPDNVTIWGHSSGGNYVGILMISPLARGLFHRAIMQSGVPLGPQPRLHDSLGSQPSAEDSGLKIARSLGADRTDALAKLRSIPAEKLINTDISSDIIVDGWVLPDQPLAMFARGQEADVPVMVGSTEREMANLLNPSVQSLSADAYRSWIKDFFGPLADEGLRVYPAPGTGDASAEFIRAQSDLYFTAPARWLAQSMRTKKSKAYLYHSIFVFDSPGGARWGAFHGSDLTLLFDTPGVPRNQSGDALARAMRQYWTQFAKTGDPNVTGQPKWPGYDAVTGSYLNLGEPIHASVSLHQEAFDLTDQLYKNREP